MLLHELFVVVYIIYLHGETKTIGNINYRGYHTSVIWGDIGYTIEPETRGNHYAYRALCLLSEFLCENGVTDFWITAHVDNIPSNKTIQKYGAHLIKSEDDVNLYLGETFIRDSDRTNSGGIRL